VVDYHERLDVAARVVFLEATLMGTGFGPDWELAHDWEGGFDWFDTPTWMFIGTNHTRELVLTDAQGMDLFSNPFKSLVSASFVDDSEESSNRRRVVVEAGRDAGEGLIEVRKGHTVAARLRVSVYPPMLRPFKVNFYRVKDKSGQLPRFNTSRVQYLITLINKLHRHQTNISFCSHLVKEELPIDFDFVTPGLSKAQIQEMFKMLETEAAQLDGCPDNLNVFWVKEFGVEDTPTDDVTGQTNRIAGNLIIVEDQASLHDDMLNLTHELCHGLGAKHDNFHEDALMHPSTAGGRKIYEDTVVQMRGTPDAAVV
jgi:hypothetical protein